MNVQKNIWADLLVLFALAAFTVWYLINSWSASSSTENLIFILPIAIVSLLMCGIECIKLLRKKQPQEKSDPIGNTFFIMVLFAAYVLSLETLGFDLGTVLFIALFLLLQGERRIFWLLAYSVVFG
ncbi:MAG: tripartite tricarboxylate transporter TctB family protein, partial [Arenicella sp.]